jgi:hypothetical protein
MRFRLTISLLLWVGAGRAAAQALRVEVRDSVARAPIPGALLSLKTTGHKLLLRALADGSGRVTVTAPGAGIYLLRADAIGYAGSERRLTLSATDLETIEFTLGPAPLTLAEITVTSSRPVVCALEAEQGTILARLWDEATKALEASELSRSNQQQILEVHTYERSLNLKRQVTSEQGTTRRSSALRPFVASDPEELHREGYIRREGRTTIFNGPDAPLLLSDQFLADHCFQVIPEAPRDRQLIGLAFESAPNRTVPDVRGTLWLDRTSAELRTLDFNFANYDLPAAGDSVGGHLEFTRLPNGAWIVGRWWIRMPMLVSTVPMASVDRALLNQKEKLIGYRESGGEATLVRAGSSPNSRTASLEGVVFDSTTMAPISGVVVSAAGGAFTDTTDRTGRYRLDVAGEGDYLIRFSSTRFDSLGMPPVTRGARLSRRETTTLDVAVPPLPALAALVCPAGARTGTPMLVGQVVDSATGAPVTQGQVVVQYAEGRAFPGTSARQVATARGPRLETDLNERGQFAICGVPPGVPAELSVRQGRWSGAPRRIVPLEGAPTAMRLAVTVPR